MVTMNTIAIIVMFFGASLLVNAVGSMYLQRQITMLRERLEARELWP